MTTPKQVEATYYSLTALYTLAVSVIWGINTLFLMDTGLLGTSLLVPLLGFNVGVELGQLLIVVAAVLIGTFLQRRIPRVMPQLVAAGLCGVGVFWFIGRTLA